MDATVKTSLVEYGILIMVVLLCGADAGGDPRMG
jgi:hypothetical protein